MAAGVEVRLQDDRWDADMDETDGTISDDAARQSSSSYSDAYTSDSRATSSGSSTSNASIDSEVKQSSEEDLPDARDVVETSLVPMNGVDLPVDQFKSLVDDFVAYTFVIEHNLTDAAVGHYLLQRSRLLTYRTPYKQNAFIYASLYLDEREVHACTNGCVAFTGARGGASACDACGAARYKRNGAPARTVKYWSLTAWLTAMLADPQLGPGMVEALAKARQAAAEPVTGVRDWYDGSNFRTAVANGLFNSDTSVALTMSTDGFEAWRQLGCQGWPVVANILNLKPSTRTKVVSQVLLTITPGPKQPVDLDSFLRPIAGELDDLAAGIDGVSVAGSDSLPTLSAFTILCTTDMPGGDKLANATGHNGRCTNRFRSFHGVY